MFVTLHGGQFFAGICQNTLILCKSDKEMSTDNCLPFSGRFFHNSLNIQWDQNDFEQNFYRKRKDK